MTKNTIVIVAKGEDEQTLKTTKRRFANNNNEVIIEEYPRPETIRGYPADLVILLDNIPEEEKNKVIKPMISINDGEIIDFSD